MTRRATAEPITTLDTPWLAIALAEGEPAVPPALAGTGAGELVARLLERREIGTGVGEVTILHEPAGLKARSLALFGLGAREKLGPGPAYAAGVALARRLASKPRDRVAVALPGGGEDVERALIEGLIVGQRGPDLRKSEPARHAFGELVIVATDGRPPAAADALLARAGVVGDAVNLARTLVNTPPGEKSPELLAARANDLARAAGVTVEVWDRHRLRQERFGGLLGVAAGSDEPPAFVVLEYRGTAAPDAPVTALVGKGVTFDSGGLSLKPSASMEDMKADMSGAATVLATLVAVAGLGLPVHVRGYLALTENLTGGRAMKLGDVLAMRNGKTVEVMNTDAEGRLILADALSYAVEAKPARVIDLATLTGACLVALGPRVAGLFSNDDGLAAALHAACARTGERTWRLPLDEDYAEGLKSPVADLKNIGGKWGGAITAAKFLEAFVGPAPWAHLDIAGPAWADGEAATRDAGGTGCFVRTLVRLFEATGAAGG
jgi:leucyl aminopeptidase